MKYSQKLAVELDDQSLTYSELLYYTQVLSLNLVNKHKIVPGEIICQCVERSLSMMIGMVATEMIGGAYCSLSPRDPKARLQDIIKRTNSRVILTHSLTKNYFNDSDETIDIDVEMDTQCKIDHNDLEMLSDVPVTLEHVSYIVFTSGSTGVPKGVQVRHRNFTQCIRSHVYMGVLNSRDNIGQIAACTFDPHIEEILGALMIGSSVIMLHLDGHMDMAYLLQTIRDKQISYALAVPSLLDSLCAYVRQNKVPPLTTIHTLCSTGEALSKNSVQLFSDIITENCCIWNCYGPSETTLGATCQKIDIRSNTINVPIGRPFMNYQCVIRNRFEQSVIIDEEGELLVGGVGVFAGYLTRDDLTAKALVQIDNELFYRTGDLVRMDKNGLLHYKGRKDHQIKLHGQRIELGEIEQCLLQSSVSACVVVKWNDDHLVAYVQSSNVDEKQLREHCQSHLPPHMIPSKFIVLEKLPLNSNGKIDRKQLPSPDFSNVSSTTLETTARLLVPRNEIETTIHHIWCDILHQTQISIDTNIFSIGGHSLLIMQLFHRYKIEFHTEGNAYSISDLFQHPTILGHAQLIRKAIDITHNIDNGTWSPLHLVEARASFAQERIFLDEQIRFSTKNDYTMYVIPMLYRISSSTNPLSVSRLCRAFHSVLIKHNVLRTALYVNADGIVVQRCLDTNIITDDTKPFGFSVINVENNNGDDDLAVAKTMNEILNDANLFDLSKGRVIQCHVFRRCRDENEDFSSRNDDLLIENDSILFNIHHSVFDGASFSTFLTDLSVAYGSDDLLSADHDETIQYMDYSVYERQMDMSLSRDFWQSQFQGYNLQSPLLLPIDRQRAVTDQRSGLASIVEITFDNDVATSFLNYASSHHVTPFQLGLAIFYAFLFKLTHGQNDLCIASLNANRYRNELQNVIGMFVSTLPYRIELDRCWTFDELVKHVQEKMPGNSFAHKLPVATYSC
ncbi:unnamed protein product [Adineta ricciae]|uniref:Carrier domain-containing protein n=1 Tax=Adineta ricciae TaxID=249248 RepID=A0A816CSJ2_ADIRI|nr:unnamed protein product [Adineta ricciae]